MNTVTQNEPQTCSTASCRRTVSPRYNIRETTDAYVVTAHLPGVDRTALETTVDGETLTVSGRRTFTAPEGWTQVYREIPQSDFRLTLELDRRVNRDAVKAELSNGVLTLTLPKAEELKPRKIEVRG